MPYGQGRRPPPPSSFTIFFEYHPQVEPTEEVPERKAAEVFSIEVKEPKPVRKYNTFPILQKDHE